MKPPLVLATLLCSSFALAQNVTDAKKTDPLASSPAVKQLWKASGKLAEDRIVPMVLNRVDLEGEARTRSEAQLDALVLVRWVAGLKLAGDEQAAVQYLRLMQLQAAGQALQQGMAKELQPQNRIQQNAARQLHQLTYELPASADVAKLDEICRNAGIYILELATGEVANSQQIPQMRPSSLPPAPAEKNAPAIPTRGTIDVTDPSRLIPNLSVSQPLRRQLLATLDMLNHPGENDIAEADARQLRKVLDDSIDIAAGLAGNAGVSADDRMALERQLTEALALFSDRRLRELATRRIGELSQYRQVLGSITRLKLSEANYKLLAPAFEYAQKNPKDAKSVLPAVEKFVACCSVIDQVPAVLSYPANPALAKSVQKPYDDSLKSFEAARSSFLQAAEQLGGGGISGSAPADLESRLDEMRLSLDVIDSLQAMPEALDFYSVYKLKPPGGLERRIAKEAQVAASPGKGPLRAESAGVLKDLVRVADVGRRLSKAAIEGGELEILKGYTKKTPEDLTAKWQSNVNDIVSQAASGAPMDAAKIDRNERLLLLIQSLPTIVAMETQLLQAPKLDRWVDWGLDARAIDQVAFAYRGAAAGAFLAFLADGTDGMKAWPTVQRERKPMMTLLVRSIGGAAQLPELPTPMHMHCAKLMTPLNTTAYSTQRLFSLANLVLNSADTPPDVAAQIRAMLNQRLAQ